MNKLKISFLALFVFASLSASAQVSFGIKGGLNISNMNISEKAEEGEKRTVKPGFNLGITADYMFNENMGVQSGLSFTTLGTISKSSRTEGANKAELKNTLALNALQLPVHFAYKINFTENCKITLHGGPYVGYILSGKVKLKGKGTIDGKTEKESESYDLYGKESNMNRFDAGLGFGVAFGYNNCYIDLGYDMGLLNLYKIDKKDKEAMKTAKVDIPYVKTMNIYLSVGYKF